MLFWLSNVHAANITKGNFAEVEFAITVKFTDYVFWPGQQFSETDPILVGVWGEDPIYDYLQEKKLFSIKNHLKHPVQLQKVTRLEEIEKCNVLLIGRKETNLREVLAKISGKPILTISAAEGFLEHGGMLQLVRTSAKVRFNAHLPNLAQSGLKPDSRMLVSALDVIRE